jgi:hypothetical protein
MVYNKMIDDRRNPLFAAKCRIYLITFRVRAWARAVAAHQ